MIASGYEKSDDYGGPPVTPLALLAAAIVAGLVLIGYQLW